MNLHLQDSSDDEPSPAPAKPLVSRGRSSLVHASLVFFALAIVARAGQLQLVEGRHWGEVAARQQVREIDDVPPRGRILDATGSVLVESRELVQVQVDPRALKPSRRFTNPRRTVREGLIALRVHDSLVRRALDTTRKWVEIPNRFLPGEVERFAGVPGVWRRRVLRRTMSAPPGIVDVIGQVNGADVPKGGIEQELDSLLRGVRGRSPLLADGRGNYVETPQLEAIAARPGHTVALTINRSLQEIAERELALAMQRTGASGGDVVMLDPRDGSILALAGARDRRTATTATAMTEPYEPGSVMKPFLVARLLDTKRADPDESINTENGLWTVAKRTIDDEHKAPFMTLRDVIRFSSNVGVAKLAARMSPREEFETLRDFGFGVPTGVPYPAESRGRLPHPRDWDGQTRESLAMGYAVSATPLQIAAAYAALANGGELLQPVLIREIVDPDGAVVYRHSRRVVRRVLSAETATLMRSMLESVVDSGTATAAELATFDVAGKSGTARRTTGRTYVAGQYNSTFAGMFPAQAPQYVFVAKLIDPQGKIYGGTVAGLLVNGILQSALATRDASLDRAALAAVAKPLPAPKKVELTPAQQLAALKDSLRRDSLRAPAPAPVEPVAAPSRVVVTLPLADTSEPRGASRNASRNTPRGARSSRARSAAEPASRSVPVPTVYGLDVRQAVRTLHAAGFQVRIAKGVDGRTHPASGSLARAGSTVTLESRQ